MLSQLLNIPCTITLRRRGTERDDYGNRIPIEETIETVCEIQQKSRKEPALEGETSDTEWLAIFPAGTELNTGAAVSAEGLGDFELIGDPWPARNPRTKQIEHIKATLRSVRGSDDEEGS